MILLLQAIREKQPEHRIAMSKFYEHFGITRQGFHQAQRANAAKRDMMDQISSMVISHRKNVDFRAGSRSLYYNLGIKELFGIGVTKFEEMMSVYGYSLQPLRVRVVTTKSDKQSWNYPNLASGLHIDNINQLVVGDLTYINIKARRFYLFCLTDVYSSRIVGYCFSSRMRSIEAQKAVRIWMRLRGKKRLFNCIHHTDGGAQYFSDDYLHLLKKEVKVRVSCARTCLENGYAEQRNGLIKNHLIPTLNVNDNQDLAKGIDRTIRGYNVRRKQAALGWLSPVEFEKHLTQSGNRPVKILATFTND